MRSVKLGIVVATLLLGTSLSTPAFATNNQDHTCQGGHNCNTGTGGDTNVDVDVDVTNKNYNTNTNKAYGGDGGDAKAYGGKVENSGNSSSDVTNSGNSSSEVKNSGNSYNKNENEIKNSGNSEIKNSGNSEIKNSGNSEIKNSGNSYNKNENEQEQKQHQQQQQSQEIKNSGNSYSKNENDNSNSNNASQDVEVNTYNQRAPVNTAYAAGLTVGEDTCMGSSSIGAQAVSFGLSIGTTWQDDNCRRLKNSRQLVALGYHRAATSLMCVDEDVKNAMIMAGTPCPNGEVLIVAPPPVRVYEPMAPVVDRPHRKVRKVRKALPPK